MRRQCTLLNLARSGVYRPKPVPAADDLAVMRRIDELHLELPFYGSRRMMFELNKEGRGVNRKRVRRLMRVWASRPVPRPGTSKAAPGTRSIPICCGIWRSPAEPGVGDRHHLHPDGARLCVSGGGHRLGQPGVLSWRLSITMDSGFCVEALEEALAQYGKPRFSTPIKARSSPAPRSPAS